MSAVVHIVDDDAGVLVAMGRALKADGLDVTLSRSTEEFLGVYDPDQLGCVVLDLHMPGIDGLQLQQMLCERGQPPLIFVSGTTEVASCAQAMRAGALDFLTKPVEADVLVAAVLRGIQADSDRRERRSRESVAERCYQTLTPRERDVLPHVLSGRLNKQIASDLGIALKTTKVHRSRILHKFGVLSVAELVRMAELVGVYPEPRH